MLRTSSSHLAQHFKVAFFLRAWFSHYFHIVILHSTWKKCVCSEIMSWNSSSGMLFWILHIHCKCQKFYDPSKPYLVLGIVKSHCGSNLANICPLIPGQQTHLVRSIVMTQYPSNMRSFPRKASCRTFPAKASCAGLKKSLICRFFPTKASHAVTKILMLQCWFHVWSYSRTSVWTMPCFILFKKLTVNNVLFCRSRNNSQWRIFFKNSQWTFSLWSALSSLSLYLGDTDA